MENVNDVAAAIIDELGEIDAMSLEKLLYFAQSWNLAISNEPLFPDEFRAWRNGPVIRAVFDQHRGQKKVSEWRSGDPKNISQQTANLIRLVGTQYGHMNGYQLSKLTHDDGPWKDVRGDLPEKASSNIPIPQSAMANHYRHHDRLLGWGALEIALGGILEGDREVSPSELERTPADTPVCGYGQRGLTAEQTSNVRARRRARMTV